MSGKVFIHQEEEGKHLFRDKDDDSIYHGVQGDDDTNRVAGDAKFKAYDKDEFISEELRKAGKVAIDEDELEWLQSRNEDESNGLSPEEQEWVNLIRQILGSALIYVGSWAGKKMIQWSKPRVKRARLELKYKFKEWRNSGNQANFQSVFFEEIENALRKVTNDPDDVIHRRNFQQVYFQAIVFTQGLEKRNLRKWKKKWKSINQKDWNRAVEICIGNCCDLVQADEVLLLEDKSLMRRVEKENELLQNAQSVAEIS